VSSAGSPASSAVAATPSPAPLAGKKLAWVLWGTDPYAQANSGSFKQAAEAAGATVTIIDGKNDPLVQSKAIDTLIASHVDGIVWQPADPASGVQPAKKIRAAGIPLVFAGTEPDASSGITAPFVGGNTIVDLTKQAGKDAATFVTQTLHGTPKVVLFDILNVPICHEQRMVPFMDGVKSVSPDAQTVFWDTVPFTKDGNITKMENLLQSHPDFNIFTGCGGDLILGGFTALQNAGRGKAVNGVPKTEWVLMIDGTPEQLVLQIDPTASVVETISQTPHDNGLAALDLMTRMITGALKPESSETPSIPGVLYSKTESCDQINQVFTQQFGAVYKALDCSKSPSPAPSQ
jgi:ABC-type sugar transport system substrate-binding protein